MMGTRARFCEWGDGVSVVSKSILGFVLPAVNGTVCKPCDNRDLIRESQFYA